MVALLLPIVLLSPMPKGGFRSIFDGKTLDGWKSADMSHWSVKDGAITGTISAEKPLGRNIYMVWHEPMADFELKMRFRLTGSPGNNGGFQFRSRLLPDGDMAGYQMDNNRDTSWLVRLYEEHGRETFAFRGNKATIKADGTLSLSPIPGAGGPSWFRLEEWHEYHLICLGSRIVLRVDGRLAAEVDDGDPTKQAPSGLLGLQLHTGAPQEAQFKDIRLKTLAPGTKFDPAWVKTNGQPTKSVIADRTLVAWVQLANLSQRGGTALTLQRDSEFDGLVFGEKEPGKWMLGSNFFARTQTDQAQTPAESTVGQAQLAAVTQGTSMRLYRDAQLIASYSMDPLDLLSGRDSFAVFGLRHFGASTGETLKGSIDDARIYGKALSETDLAALRPNQAGKPKPVAWWTFEPGQEADRVGLFRFNKLIGGAKIEGGHLVLGNEGDALIATKSASPAWQGKPTGRRDR
ncbi:MAG: family 16 glycoside hydrolase [Fimbriimonas sp.]